MPKSPQHASRLRRLARTSVAAVALSPAPAWAADWQVTPRISVGESFTDNTNLVQDNQDRNSELTTEVSPSVSVRGQGGRVNLNLDYGLSALYFKNDTHTNTLRNNLTSTGRAELWEQAVFLDAQASISRQVINSQGASSNSVTGQENNRANVIVYNVAPSFRHHFGTWLETESRINYSQVDVGSSAVSNTQTLDERFNAHTGREFGRLQAGLDVVNSKTMRDDRFPAIKSMTLDTNYSYAYSRQIALLWGVGYEHYEDPTLLSSPVGVTWNVGTALTPDPQTSLRITGGERFDARNIDVDARYQISSRTAFTARYLQTLQTTQQALAGDLAFITVNDQGVLTDSRTGLPFRPGNENFDLQSTTVRSDRFTAGVNATRGRNSYNLRGSWEKRTTESTNAEQIVTGAAFTYGRQLTPRTRASFTLDYANTDFGGTTERVDDRYLTNFLVSYDIFRNTSLDLSFARTQRFSSQDANDLTENAAFVRLNRVF